MSAATAPLAVRIDAALPQTQCTRCGYDACRPYAEAVAAGEADINRCPPGGPATIAVLAGLTGAAAKPLDAACGTHGPLLLAVIDEDACIGCTLCIAACPVDAIIGAPRRMHAVLPSLCSGCELCVAPCPVDCIAMVPATRPWTVPDADAARTRHASRAARLVRGERVAQRLRIAGDRETPENADPLRQAAGAVDPTTRTARAAAVAAALARARARRRTTAL
jgi:electron transport complex protein RnfB